MIWILVQTLLIGALGVAALFDFGPRIVPGRSAAAETIGALLLAAGCVVAILAFRDLGRAIRIRPAPREGASLVDRGIYGWLRHPMYTAVAAACAGIALREASWPAALAAAAVVGFYLVKARHEESLLVAAYPGYAEYRSRTFGVLPWRRG